MNREILFLYYSGAGSTRTIAKSVFEKIKVKKKDLHNIFKFNFEKIHDYDLIIFLFPTYHERSPVSFFNLIKKLPKIESDKRIILVTTYGLYPGGSIRIVSKELKKKNYITIGNHGIRGPASDGVILITDKIKFLKTYEKKAKIKVDNIIKNIEECIFENIFKEKIQKFKWYTPLNYVNRYFGNKKFESFSKKIKIDHQKCIKCGVCIGACHMDCFYLLGEEDNSPKVNTSNCEFCLKCIHHCPTKAIDFGVNIENKELLTEEFYKNAKREYFD